MKPPVKIPAAAPSRYVVSAADASVAFAPYSAIIVATPKVWIAMKPTEISTK